MHSFHKPLCLSFSNFYLFLLSLVFFLRSVFPVNFNAKIAKSVVPTYILECKHNSWVETIFYWFLTYHLHIYGEKEKKIGKERKKKKEKGGRGGEGYTYKF